MPSSLLSRHCTHSMHIHACTNIHTCKIRINTSLEHKSFREDSPSLVWLPEKTQHKTEPSMCIPSFPFRYCQCHAPEILTEVPHKTKLAMLYKLRYVNLRLINIKMLPCWYKWSSEICLAQCIPQHTWEIMKLSEMKI